jgi:xanthine dehydrogenase accessory factor
MDIYETIVNLQKQARTGVLITVVRKDGHGPQIPGAKLLICADGKNIGTIGGGALEHTAKNEALALFKNKSSILKKYLLGEDSNIANPVSLASSQHSDIETGMICGGSITLFFEYIGTKDNVIIFGAGHVGKALAYYLKPLNYNTTLLDSRENILNEVRDIHKHLLEDYNNIPVNKVHMDNAYVVITTHSHEFDYKVLKSVYESNTSPKYIGLIASKKKSEKMIERLSSEINKTIDLNRLYTPIGLKIGGTSPEEIALSIASELQVIKYKQEGNKHARRMLE